MVWLNSHDLVHSVKTIYWNYFIVSIFCGFLDKTTSATTKLSIDFKCLKVSCIAVTYKVIIDWKCSAMNYRQEQAARRKIKH